MKTQLLLPPDDGSRNVVTVYGRVYQSAPGVPVAVPSFDIPTLEANGWMPAIAGSASTTTSAYAAGSLSGVVTSPGGSPAGLGVRLFIDGAATPVGVAAADANGAWAIATGNLAPGPHAFSIEIDESAGSFSVSSQAGGGTMDFSTALNSGLLAAIAA